MHSTACGVGASSANSANASMHSPTPFGSRVESQAVQPNRSVDKTTSVPKNSAANRSVIPDKHQRRTDGLKMVHNNDDALNKIPLKSASGLDDEEKHGGEFVQDTNAAEEARREQMRANILKWMKKLTIVLICFIGLALISYVIISLCFSDWPKSASTFSSSSNSSLLPDDDSSNAALQAANATSDSGSGLNATDTTLAPVDFSIKQSTSPLAATNATLPASTTVNYSTTKKLAETPTTIATTATTGAATAQTTVPPTEANTHKPAMKPLLQDTPPLLVEEFESKLGVYEKAAVCSDREVCSEVGSQILAQDGSAVDAAIATMLCNGILTMHSMGIGGGMLMNVYLKDKQHAFSIDAREVAPFAAYPEMYANNPDLSINGGLAIAVPGELMGYHTAHKRFGKLPWKKLVEPSLQLCKDGFYITHHQWNALNYRWPHIKNNTVLTDVFVNNETGKLHPVGTKIKPQPALCETYRLLAENGPLDFYNGTLSQLAIEDLKDLGSSITSYDLESYTADLVSSITMQLGDDILYAVPPVSSGIVVANLLSVLEGFNFTKADLEGTVHKANTMHRFAEAMKYGFAKRWELGDLRFNDVRELISKLTNPEYGLSIREKIDDATVHKEIFDYGATVMGEEDIGTSPIVVLAPNGDAVSVTSSVNEYFGGSQAGKRTGIVFNSAMNDFSIPGTPNLFELPVAPSNLVDAHKRPMSSMSPMILADQKGNVRLAVSAAGGTKIISALAEVMARVLWFDEDIKRAIDAPRFHHQLLPNVLQYQLSGFNEEVLKLLKAKGHVIQPYKDIGSVVCGIVRNSTAIYANSDYRKRGGTAGF